MTRGWIFAVICLGACSREIRHDDLSTGADSICSSQRDLRATGFEFIEINAKTFKDDITRTSLAPVSGKDAEGLGAGIYNWVYPFFREGIQRNVPQKSVTNPSPRCYGLAVEVHFDTTLVDGDKPIEGNLSVLVGLDGRTIETAESAECALAITSSLSALSGCEDEPYNTTNVPKEKSIDGWGCGRYLLRQGIAPTSESIAIHEGVFVRENISKTYHNGSVWLPSYIISHMRFAFVATTGEVANSQMYRIKGQN